jgi:putative membrane protein
MIGVALGLLLVFRTNASFDRWWEGRKLLGHMVNRTRDVARQLVSYLPADERAAATTATRWLGAFYFVSMQGLRGETDLAAAGELLDGEERAVLEPVKARGPVVLSWISRTVDRVARAGKLSEARLLAIDGNLTALMDDVGACERIVRTPVPLAYAQHIKLFVTLWCFTVPFALVDAMGWLTCGVSAILAFALFGIDEIGVEIEDPFGYDANDLPVEAVGRTIRANTMEIIASDAPPTASRPE